MFLPNGRRGFDVTDVTAPPMQWTAVIGGTLMVCLSFMSRHKDYKACASVQRLCGGGRRIPAAPLLPQGLHDIADVGLCPHVVILAGRLVIFGYRNQLTEIRENYTYSDTYNRNRMEILKYYIFTK